MIKDEWKRRRANAEKAGAETNFSLCAVWRKPDSKARSMNPNHCVYSIRCAWQLPPTECVSCGDWRLISSHNDWHHPAASRRFSDSFASYRMSLTYFRTSKVAPLCHWLRRSTHQRLHSLNTENSLDKETFYYENCYSAAVDEGNPQRSSDIFKRSKQGWSPKVWWVALSEQSYSEEISIEF